MDRNFIYLFIYLFFYDLKFIYELTTNILHI